MTSLEQRPITCYKRKPLHTPLNSPFSSWHASCHFSPFIAQDKNSDFETATLSTWQLLPCLNMKSNVKRTGSVDVIPMFQYFSWAWNTQIKCLVRKKYPKWGFWVEMFCRISLTFFGSMLTKIWYNNINLVAIQSSF